MAFEKEPEKRRGAFSSGESPLAGSGGLSAASNLTRLPTTARERVAVALAQLNGDLSTSEMQM